MSSRVHRDVTASGVRLRVAEDGTGPTVLLLHGLAASLRADPSTVYVPPGWRNLVVAIDLLIIVLLGIHLWRLFRLDDVRKRSKNP